MAKSLQQLAVQYVIILIAMLIVFCVDIELELGVAGGVPYVGVVCLAYLRRDRRVIWVVAVGCCFLTVLGYFFSPPGGVVWKVVLNRSYALGAIVVTAVLGDLATRRSQRLLQIQRDLNRLVERRTAELEKRMQEAEAAERELNEVATRLAWPLEESEPSQEIYSLDSFSLSSMLVCGAAIRQFSRANATPSEFSNALVRLLYEQSRDDDGNTEFALVRLFRTQHFAELAPSLQEFVHTIEPATAAETICLELVATMGNRAEWCDVSRSLRHQAIPLPSEDAIERLPMISHLLQQLGLSAAGVLEPPPGVLQGDVETGVFHVPHAEGSPQIPAQQEFVIPNGIKSVVGFGGLLPGGSLFVVIGFATKFISGDVAQLLSHLSHSVRLGLLSYMNVSQKTVSQIRAFDRLLADREAIVVDQEMRLRQVVAELANLNEALEASNVELQQFAYIASHDLQAPLRTISGFAELLQDGYQGQLDATANDYIEHVVEGTKRMQKLIEDLLSYSRIEQRSAPFQPVSLNEVFDDALALLHASIQESGGEVTRDELPTVSGDRAQLSQLLQNLITNGIKYQGDHTPRVHATSELSGEQWVCAFSDNGIGVAAEHHERIFEMFYRLHTQQRYPGTGIGLAVCRRIVQRHGGKIWLESQPGQGTTFFFTIGGASSQR